MRRALLLALLLLPVPLGAAPRVPLQLPDPLRLADYAEPAEVARGVVAALEAKHWQVESDNGTAIVARRESRGATLRVRIEYSVERMTYRYVDSTGFDYARLDGEDYIHPAANKWLSRLAKQVRAQVLRYPAERDETQVVPLERDDGADAPPPGT